MSGSIQIKSLQLLDVKTQAEVPYLRRVFHEPLCQKEGDNLLYRVDSLSSSSPPRI